MITFSDLSVVERRACLDRLDYLNIFRMPAHPRTEREHRMASAYARLKDYCCGVGDVSVPRDREQRLEWDDAWNLPLQGSWNLGFPLYLDEEGERERCSKIVKDIQDQFLQYGGGDTYHKPKVNDEDLL